MGLSCRVQLSHSTLCAIWHRLQGDAVFINSSAGSCGERMGMVNTFAYAKHNMTKADTIESNFYYEEKVQLLHISLLLSIYY